MKTLKIQPLNSKVTERLPYPYFVEVDTLNVKRQDFWQGKPLRFLCFEEKNGNFISMQDVVDGKAKLNKGISPCFQDEDGTQYTMKSKHGFEYSFEVSK